MSDDPVRQAAALAYFLASMGLIDTPGGAEWIGRRWSPEDLNKRFAAAQEEVGEKPHQRILDLFDYSGHDPV